MARFFTDFTEYPTGDITTSGQTDWTPRITNGAGFRIILDENNSPVLRIATTSTNGTNVLSYNPLNGVSDNIETLVKYSIFKSDSDGSVGRFGTTYIRYGGTSEATTIGFAVSFVPVYSAKSLAIYEDSVDVINYINVSWQMNNKYWLRTRISGNNQYIKTWEVSSVEPSSWSLQTNATPKSISNPYTGVGTYAGSSFLYVEQFSAATNGDIAPMFKPEEIPSIYRAKIYDGTSWNQGSVKLNDGSQFLNGTVHIDQ